MLVNPIFRFLLLIYFIVNSYSFLTMSSQFNDLLVGFGLPTSIGSSNFMLLEDFDNSKLEVIRAYHLAIAISALIVIFKRKWGLPVFSVIALSYIALNWYWGMPSGLVVSRLIVLLITLFTATYDLKDTETI